MINHLLNLSIQPVMLWTDFFIYLLVTAMVVACIWIRRYPHLCRPWRQVAKKPVAMITLAILLSYLTVGLLDSMHYKNNYSNEVMSMLDYCVSPLGQVVEKSYTAPFAVQIDTEAWYFSFKYLGFSALLIFAGYFYLRRAAQINHRAHSPWIIAFVTIGFIMAAAWLALALSTHYHILGTDKVGQDVFYQSLKSVRTGLVIGLITSLVVLPFAIGFGISAGYFGGFIDDCIQYIYTTLSSVPGVLLISAAVLSMQIFIAHHAEHFTTIMQRADVRLLALCIILGVTGWTPLCRLLRGEAMKLRQIDFVVASIALGVGHARIIFKHILPNVLHIVIITIVLDFSGLVLAEAVLSYVGVGVDPTTISWGNMINSARLELAREPVVWWPLCSAFLFMFVLVLAANLFADVVREAFDPRGR